MPHPQPCPLARLVRVAGSRWGVEDTFQFAKNETGLDHYQVRHYDAWYRHITLSMLAAAFLAVTARAEWVRDAKGAPLKTANVCFHRPATKIRRLRAVLTWSA
jgi:SRSO17 transposase